jgi:DNA-binding response OmpR family regulator
MQAKLLLIEDTASLAETLARGFAEAGFETRIAHTAAAASLALESDPPDALILDLGLPDLDGLELLCEDPRAGPGDSDPGLDCAGCRAKSRRSP